MIKKKIFLPNLSSKPILFLDRDGVVNLKPAEHHYVTKWEDFSFNQGIFDFLETMQDYFQIIVITNQQGIAKGLYTDNQFLEMTNRMNSELLSKNIFLKALYYCPHSQSDNCICRKPSPGLILQALQDNKIESAKCLMVGDSKSDIEASIASGILYNYLISSNKIRELDPMKIINETFKK